MEAVLFIGDVRISAIEVLMHTMDMHDGGLLLVDGGFSDGAITWEAKMQIEERALVELHNYMAKEMDAAVTAPLLWEKPPQYGVYRNKFTSGCRRVIREKSRIRNNC